MTEASRAAQVLEAVREGIEPPQAHNGYLRLLDSWTEGEDTICVVYEGWWYPGTLGLRRNVEANVPAQHVVEDILSGDLGEPLGGLVDALVPDDNGVMWWEGNPPEWRHYH